MSQPRANRIPFHVGASPRGNSDWNAERRQYYASMQPNSDRIPMYTTADIHGLHYARERNGGSLATATIHQCIMRELKEVQARMAFAQLNVLKTMLEREYEYARLYRRTDCMMGDHCQMLEEQIPKIKKMERDLDNLITQFVRWG